MRPGSVIVHLPTGLHAKSTDAFQRFLDHEVAIVVIEFKGYSFLHAEGATKREVANPMIALRACEQVLSTATVLGSAPS